MNGWARISPGRSSGKHPLQNRIDIFAVGAALRQAPQLPEMHIDRQVGVAADLGRHLDDADAPARKAADLGMRLDAAHEIAVLGGGPYRGIDIDAVGPVEIGVIVPFQATHQIGGEEGVGTRLGFRRDEVPETRQGHAGGAALIDQRRDAGLNADHVGIHAEAAGDILVDMGVGVDQSGQDDCATNVHDFLGAGRQNIRLNGSDLAVADGDILRSIDA